MNTFTHAAAILMLAAAAASASDHLDTPSVIADPRTDIGDLYAWMSPDARQLNLVMTIVGHSFSDQIDYVFHIDSGKRFGKTTHTATIRCRFPAPEQPDCRLDGAASGGMRVFAGLRDDPFFNNVKGTRAAYSVAAAAQGRGLPVDAAGCVRYTDDDRDNILTEWRHTDGKPAANFLAGWTPATIVIAIDRTRVARGGNVLAVWGATVGDGQQIDRAARPLTGNALLGTLAPDEESDALKERYNAATPATSAAFIPEIEKGLALYDGFDGKCGNSWLAGKAPAKRYRKLAALLADDRLWVNAAAGHCTQLFAVELAALSGRKDLRADCGGRTPNYDAVNVYRSLLANGTTTGISDGLDRDERSHSTTEFPFLAAP